MPLIDQARQAYHGRREKTRQETAKRFAEVFGQNPDGVSSDGSWVNADGLIFRYRGGEFFVLVRCGACLEFALHRVGSLEELGEVISGDFFPQHRCWRPLPIPQEVAAIALHATIPIGCKRGSLWEEGDEGVEEQDCGGRRQSASRRKG